MKLYKKILKSIVIAIILGGSTIMVYEAFLKDLISDRYNANHVYGVDASSLLFLLSNLVIIVFHVHFFNVYNKNKVWRDTTVLEIVGFIINFLYSSLFFLFGFMMAFSRLDVVPYIMLALGGYLFVESVFIIRYLKRDTTNEMSSLVEEIGEN